MRLGGSQSRSGRCGGEKNLSSSGIRTLAVQHVAHHYTDWAIPTPQHRMISYKKDISKKRIHTSLYILLSYTYYSRNICMPDLMSHLVERQVLPVGRIPLVEKHFTRSWTKPRKPVNFSLIYRQQNPLWLVVYVYPHYNDYQVMLSEHWTKFTEGSVFLSSVANRGVLVFSSSFPNCTVHTEHI
jgi:hypothetical protein